MNAFAKIGALATGLLWAASAASAADLPARVYTKAPAVVAPLYNWTGFYLGAHAGYGWGDSDWSNISLTAERVALSPDGFVGGGQLGYRWQLNQFVLGVEGSFSGADLKDSYTSVVNPAVSYQTKMDWLATVTGQLGVSFGPTLIYVSGGGAFTTLKTRGINSTFDSFSNSGSITGFTVGGGLEYALSPNWSVGVDYKYIDFGSENRSGTTTTLLLPYTQTNIDTRVSMITGRINYRFGGPAVRY